MYMRRWRGRLLQTSFTRVYKFCMHAPAKLTHSQSVCTQCWTTRRHTAQLDFKKMTRFVSLHLLILASSLDTTFSQWMEWMDPIPQYVKNQVDEWTRPMETEAAFQPVVSKHAHCQKKMSKSMPFPCKEQFRRVAPRSPSPPTSVHRLRPGDIDVVAALGDSLVAGDGALDDSPFSVFIQYRGVSWCVGGQSDWRQYLTLPNILKQFNPNVTGFSTGEGSYQASNSRFNIAMPAALDDDTLQQAQILVARIRADPSIDFHNSWKLVTIFIGHNDLCSKSCFEPAKHTAQQHKKHLMKALDYLRKNLPRTYVTLITVGDVTFSMRVQRSLMCKIMHPFLCACLHRGLFADPVKWVGNLAREYVRVEKELVSSGRYANDPQFTVELMPFTTFMHRLGISALPSEMKTSIWMTDDHLIGPDCFHLSQAGSALIANMYWNNLLEPSRLRTTTPPKKIFDRFLCPTERAPYLFTSRNSQLFMSTGSQMED